jgi:hypothetical protein
MFMNSLGVLCMEMSLVFSNKNSLIMRYFHILCYSCLLLDYFISVFLIEKVFEADKDRP